MGIESFTWQSKVTPTTGFIGGLLGGGLIARGPNDISSPWCYKLQFTKC